MIKKIYLTLFLFFTVSCAGTVKLDDVKIDTSKVKTEMIEGNYAIYIQNDDWIMKSTSKENFWTGYCPSFESTTDLKPVFTQTMNDVVRSTFQNVKFVSSELSTQKIIDGGFDALISIKHSEAISNFTSQYVVFGFKLKTTTNVGVEFYVKGKNGKEFSKVSKSYFDVFKQITAN